MAAAYSGKLKPDFIAKAYQQYQRYMSDMAAWREKVKENDKWYKCNYSRPLAAGANEPAPATAFISSAIFSRYADYIDNYPTPNVLERRPEDTETAKKLRDIIPIILELSEFKKKYKRNCYNKMKNGSGIYGVFYDEVNKAVQISVVDVLDFYCDIHCDDIQDSQYIFVRNAVDNQWLKAQYPQYADLFEGDCTIEGREGNYTSNDRTEVLDCYYKKPDGTVHMMKMIKESMVIDATEDRQGYENGLYNHRLYPFIIDTMYPDDDNIMGFSLIDITRNPQMYIDKLDAAILKNAMLSSHPRWLIKDNGGINKREFTDMSNEVISSAADVDEKNIRMFQVNSLPTFVREHRERKIDELKEIAGSRDWQTGGTAKGVTAASAIEALQSTGQKLSRANIDDTYDSYRQLVYMVIELMRQFFTTPETYRITNENGKKEFIKFSNKEMYSNKVDAFGSETGSTRKAEYDVQVIPQKENPFTRETNNQTINALWTAGYFVPDNMKLSIMALKCMHFDGKDQLIEMMQEYIDDMEQQQAQQQQMQMLQQEQQPQEDTAQTAAGPQGDLIPIAETAPEADLSQPSDLIPVAQL